MPRQQFNNGDRLVQGEKFDVWRVPVPTSDGSHRPKEIITHPGAVVILPLLGPREIVLIRNFRHAAARELWELPAGTLDEDEQPASAAGRELREETGYEAGNLEPLIGFYTAPGFCDEFLHVFLARDLTAVGQALEDTEQITTHVRTLEQTMEMMRQGDIIDAKTMAAILFYRTFGLKESDHGLA